MSSNHLHKNSINTWWRYKKENTGYILLVLPCSVTNRKQTIKPTRKRILNSSFRQDPFVQITAFFLSVLKMGRRVSCRNNMYIPQDMFYNFLHWLHIINAAGSGLDNAAGYRLGGHIKTPWKDFIIPALSPLLTVSPRIEFILGIDWCLCRLYMPSITLVLWQIECQ